MGLLDALEAQAPGTAYAEAALVRRVAREAREDRGRLLAAGALGLLVGLANAALPFLTTAALEAAVTDRGTTRVLALLAIGALVGGAGWALGVVSGGLAGAASENLVLRLRRALLRALPEKGLAFFQSRATGELASRVVVDTAQAGGMIRTMVGALGDAALVIGLSAVLLVIDPELGAVTLALGALICAVTFMFRRASRVRARRMARATGALAGHVLEITAGAEVIRSFGAQAPAEREFDELHGGWYRATLAVNRLFSGIFPALVALTGCATVAVVAVGGPRVADGSLALPTWFLFLQCVALFWGPITGLSSVWSSVQSGLASAERVFSVIDEQPQGLLTGTVAPEDLRGRIEMDDVSFRYAGAADDQLRNVSLSVEPGERIAVVGPTGAGKTTLLKLLLGAFGDYRGDIRFSGIELRDIDPAALRRGIGVVTQEVHLFEGSVADNIAAGLPGATRGQVEAVCARLAGGDWVTLFDRGLDTGLRHNGARLSAGQRQLIVLARVLLQDPDILVLDEPTSNLDPLTDWSVQQALSDAARGRTCIMVAHRPQTLHWVDRVVVVRNGVVEAQGRADEVEVRDGDLGGTR